MYFRKKWSAVVLTTILVSGFINAVVSAETLMGKTVESRILLGFKVSDSAVNKMLPVGWNSLTLPKGPVSGSNLIMAFIDRYLITDAEGKPASPSSGPILALLAYARNDNVKGIRGFVIKVYEETPLVDPYGNSSAADIDRVAGFVDSGGAVRSQSEQWAVTPNSGGQISLSLEFKLDELKWTVDGESRPYSSVRPDFFRIYRFDQLAGLAMNRALGKSLKGEIAFHSTDPAIESLFDGNESLSAIITVPTYLREISLP